MAIYENGMSPITENVGYEESNISKAYHNLSRVHQCQGIIGAEMPIDIIKTIPDDTYEELEYYMNIVSRNPLARDLRNGMTVAVHAYWSPCSELWEGWNNYVTKGRSGKVNLTVPKLLPSFKNSADSNNVYTTLVPCSPADYMGVPIRQYDNTIENKNYVFKAEKLDSTKTVNKGYEYGQTGADVMGKWGLNALPFVMYNKIHRDYYMNQNLMMKNTSWFPLNDKDFILPYNCTTTGDNTWGTSETHDYVNLLSKDTPYMPIYKDTDKQYLCDESSEDAKPLLNKLHFRQFRGDYFTSASPFAELIRGDLEEIQNAIGNINTINTDMNSFVYDIASDMLTRKAIGSLSDTIGLGNNSSYKIEWARPSNSTLTNNQIENADKTLLTKIANSINKNSTVSTNLLNKLRKAVILEKFMQRNGATNGTYREIIGSQFGYKPNQYDGKPRYLGGGTFNIEFNSVIMQGSDTTEQNTGDKVSNAEGNGIIKIPRFHADDYGYIMIIATIMPDVYYDRQGLETMWTCTTQDKEYFPIMNNLAPRPILNKELYLGKESDNEDVFGYSEYASDLRSRQNIATGLCAVGDKSLWDSSTIMHRKFNTTPVLNNANLTMYPNNIDLTPFYDANEIPFDMLIGCKVGAMRKIPYSSKPADMGIKY